MHIGQRFWEGSDDGIVLTLDRRRLYLFWKDDVIDQSFRLRVNIQNGPNKVKILDMPMTGGERYYVMQPLGSGEYEIELDCLDGTKLLQTEAKNVKLASAGQRTVEILDKLSYIQATIESVKSAIDNIDSSSADAIREYIENPESLPNIFNNSRFTDELLHILHK